jgi:manganese/zinc/iron transport system permease protein
MNSLIPPFDFERIFLDPWATDFDGFVWIVVMGFLVTATCGLLGNFLVLRRMALVGDAISHSILPGIAIAFLLTSSRSSGVMFVGALIAGILTTILIEVIHGKSRIKQDAAIGIVFSTLFAIGVILISLYAGQVDLDTDCVLYGEISFVALEPFAEIGGVAIAPQPVFTMAIVTVTTALLVLIFYKELLVSSFDPGLAASLGINPRLMHYALMCGLSVVVVSAFRSVGAIIVIAMLILPGATAYLLTHRLPMMLVLSVVHSGLSAILGLHLGIWLDCSMAGAMVVAGGVLFVLAWMFNPDRGLVWQFLRRKTQTTSIESAGA